MLERTVGLPICPEHRSPTKADKQIPRCSWLALIDVLRTSFESLVLGLPDPSGLIRVQTVRGACAMGS